MPNTETLSVPQVDPNDYKVLRPDGYHTAITSQEILLEKYIRLLNPLMEKIVGSENEPAYDSVVFLDKSARPLGWMMRKFWPNMAPQHLNRETGQWETAPMPDMKYVNIDREAWRQNPNLEIDDGGAKKITSEDLVGLREVFPTKRGINELDAKRILIIDEQSETGDTIHVSRKLFEQAFPTSHIDATAWIWHPNSVNKEGIRESDIRETPMWYPPRDKEGVHFKETGRGVLGTRAFDPNRPAHEPRFLAESYKFLSTKPKVPKKELTHEEQQSLVGLRRDLNATKDPIERGKLLDKIDKVSLEIDPETKQLRKEIGQMAVDFANGKLFPAITTSRHEILGLPADEYRAKATRIRQARHLHDR